MQRWGCLPLPFYRILFDGEPAPGRFPSWKMVLSYVYSTHKETWAWEICLGTAIGAFMGFLARKLIRFSERKKLVDRESFVAQYVSLAIASMGVNVLLGSDDLLAAFACGTAFAWDGWFQKQTQDSNFSSIVDLVFNIATFIYIGAIMPWHDFVDASIDLSIWRLIVLSILVLLLKRIPIVVLLWKWIPDIKTFQEALFSGYFGPMGVGAIFMATYGRLLLVEHVSHPPQNTNDVLALTIQPIVFFFVLTSTFVHGFTVPFFAFGKRAHSNLARTLSYAPTHPFSSDDPGWLSGIRRTMTNATQQNQEGPDGGQTSVVQAMHEGLRRMRDDSISTQDSAERQHAEDEDAEGGHVHFGGASESVEDVEPDAEDEELGRQGEDEDWGGGDTLEMRKYRARKAAERRASVQTSDKPTEQDIADLNMQREHGEDYDEDAYPRVREWLEGHKIVLEYQKEALSESETVVIPLPQEEYDALMEEESPFRSWLSRNGEKLEKYLDWEPSGNYKLKDYHTENLFKNGIPKQLSSVMSKWLHGDKDVPCEEKSNAYPLLPTHADQEQGSAAKALGSEYTHYPYRSSTGSSAPPRSDAPGSVVTMAPPNMWGTTDSILSSGEPGYASHFPYSQQAPAYLSEPGSPKTGAHATEPSSTKQDTEPASATPSGNPQVSFAGYNPPGVKEGKDHESADNAQSHPLSDATDEKHDI